MVLLVTRDDQWQTLHIFSPLICAGLLEALYFGSVIGTLALFDSDLDFLTLEVAQGLSGSCSRVDFKGRK